MAESVIELVRRFEPILHFHKDERFFPSDAKRYFEHCALWKAERPFNEKNSWGGKAQPFPRSPLIEREKIALFEIEKGSGDTFLGTQQGSAFPFLTESSNETRFLELTGWRQSDPLVVTENSEGVDSTTLNRYPALDNIATLYNRQVNPTSLHQSRFWYHAELFDTERLRVLMTRESVPGRLDLGKLFTRFVDRNPALLCYYFFIPGHDELLPGDCGPEYASFAGEWACMAILLERRNETERYMPRWIGHTGRRNVGSRQGLNFDLRIGMSVRRWQFQTEPREDPLPRTVVDHPKLFVGLGTHSLYLDQGTHLITPYPPNEAPKSCGQFETQSAANESLKSRPEDKSPAAAWGKIIAGTLLGGLPGLVAAATWTALEGLPLGSGLDAVGQKPEEAILPDVAPTAGTYGKVVHPKDLTISDPAGAEFVKWSADENLVIDNRRYNVIVNRETQIWWPSDDGKSGYRGRWGPFVTQDIFGRRAGMQFPEFWQMFFVALARTLSQ